MFILTNENVPNYDPPFFLQNGLIMTGVVDTWYGITWRNRQEKVWWLSDYSPIPWQSHIFSGAEAIPIWGQWSCSSHAKGTLILSLGLTGQVKNAWYAHLFAHKAYQKGFAVCMYDWRGHGRTAELSPVPSSYGWREGKDQVYLAEQLRRLGCPEKCVLVGFSLGGQLALWGLRAAETCKFPSIRGAATLSSHLESQLSLEHLRSSIIGRWIEKKFIHNLLSDLHNTKNNFPDAFAVDVCDQIHGIDSFDREISIPYYGFRTVEDYYKQTSCLYFLPELQHPHLMIYAQDDPLFYPPLAKTLQSYADKNYHTHLLLTQHGGHMAYMNTFHSQEDCFWGLNRLLDFCEFCLESS